MSVLKIKNGSTWEEIPAGGIGVPSGGTAGQVLLKSSATDYATQWGNYFPTIVEDVWSTTSSGSMYTTSATFTVHGSGYVEAIDNTWIDGGSSDTGSAVVTIAHNGNNVARSGSRISSAISDSVGAYAAYQVIANDGDTFYMEEYHTKSGTKHAVRRFLCWGCTVTKNA